MREVIAARIVEACRRAQIEFRVAPAPDLDKPPTTPTLRSPYQRRAR